MNNQHSITVMENEIWKDVPGFEGYYKINLSGDLMSCSRVDRFGRSIGGKLLKWNKNPNGYRLARLHKNGFKRTFQQHRILAMCFIPNPQNLPCINHKNCIRDDNRLENLEWCTMSYNNSYAHKVGSFDKTYAENHHQSKLNKVKAREIRSKYIPLVFTMKMLAAEYGVSKTVIQRVIENKTWKSA